MTKWWRAGLGVVIVLIVWELAARQWDTPLLFPSPLNVWRQIKGMIANGEVLIHLGASLQRIAVGLGIGVPVGVLIGCLMGSSRLANSAFDPYLRMANSIPAVALVPFSLLWFGVSELGRYALMVYIVLVTMMLNARQGVREVPRLRTKASETLGVSGTAAFFRVIIPSSFPSILVGIRTSIGLCVMVVVAAEMFGATSGLGYLIMQGRANYVPELIFIGILGLGFLSLALDRLFMLAIEVLTPRWSSKRRVR